MDGSGFQAAAFFAATILLLSYLISHSLASTPIAENVCYWGSRAFGNCGELKKAYPTAETGVYRLSVGCGDRRCCKDVFCEMDIKGGGWTIFQRRFEGGVEFYRDWTTYENGFGFIEGEHWLGLSYLSSCLSSGGPWDLLLTVQESNYPPETCLRFQHFTSFSVGDADSKYRFSLGALLDGNLQFGHGTGALINNSMNGAPFSTFDQDNDQHSDPDMNCAATFNGGWWFNSCQEGNLNGIFAPGCVGGSQGISLSSAGSTRYAFAASEERTKRKCGLWGEWGELTDCPSTPGCGIARTRPRQRVHTYEVYGTSPDCTDNSDPEEIQTDTRFCPEDCIEDNICEGGATVYRDCGDIKIVYQSAPSGVFLVSAGCSTQACCLPVYCNMDERIGGGGWTAIQRRFNGTIDFVRNWTDYEEGFGSVQAEHWMGLKHLHSFVSDNRSYELLIKLYEQKYPTCMMYHRYSNFRIKGAADNYTIAVTLKDSNFVPKPACPHHMSSSRNTENGRQFSTIDRDNDLSPTVSCASNIPSGWWFGFCQSSSVNGLYRSGCTSGGHGISTHYGSCFKMGYAGSELLFRPVNHVPEVPFTNLCTETDTEICIQTPAVAWEPRNCGHWSEWGEWGACPGPPTCRQSRSRGRILTLIPTATNGCEDGTSPDKLFYEYTKCNETCERTCGTFSKQPTGKLVMGRDIIHMIHGTTDMGSCSSACMGRLTCRAFHIDYNTASCVLSDSTETFVPNTDPNIHLYFLDVE